MAITRTTRFSLHRWDSGADPFNRAQIDADNLQLESFAALFRAGLDANKGSASAAAYARSFYLATDTSPATLYYSDGTNWVTVNLTGIASDIQPLTLAGSASAGTTTTTSGVTTQKYALANHIHALPATDIPVAIGTSLSAGSAVTIARSDHVHILGVGSISVANMFAAGVINAAAIGSDAVTTIKILDSNVTTAKIADSAVSTAKIADSAVTALKISATAVTAAKINSDVAGVGLVKNGTSGALDINADNSTVEIVTNTLRVKDSGVTTAKIADSGVSTVKIAALAVTAAKINSDVAGDGLLKNGVTGAIDVGVDNTTIEINADALRLKDLGVTGAKLAASVIGAGLQQNVTTKALEAKTDNSTIGVNGSGQIYLISTGSASSIPNNSIDPAKLTTSVAGDGLLGGNGTALSVNVDASTLEIVADVVRIRDNGVTTSKIASGAITTARLDQTAGTQAVTTATLRDGAVTTVKLDQTASSEAVTTATIRATAVTAAKINSDVAGVGLVKNGTSGALDVNVDNSTIEVVSNTVRLKDNGIVAAKIASGAITTAKLDTTASAQAVTTATMRDGAVTTAKLDQTSGSEAVTTATIRAQAVTAAKLGAVAGSGLTGGNGANLALNADNSTIIISGTVQVGTVPGTKLGAGAYRNGTDTTSGGIITYGTVASLPAIGATTGGTNGDLVFGY